MILLPVSLSLCQKMVLKFGALSLLLAAVASAQRIVISNDDGWAVAQIRAEVDALRTAGYDVRPDISRSVALTLTETVGDPVCACGQQLRPRRPQHPRNASSAPVRVQLVLCAHRIDGQQRQRQ